MADLRGVGPNNIPPDALCFIMETRKRACLVPLLVDRLRVSRSNWFTWPRRNLETNQPEQKQKRASVIVDHGDASCRDFDDQPMGLLSLHISNLSIFPKRLNDNRDNLDKDEKYACIYIYIK